MKALRDLNLSVKANLIIGGILTLAFLLVSFILVETVTGLLLQSANARGHDLAVLFAKLNSLPLSRMDYYSVENNTKEFIGKEDVIFARVVDPAGVVITPSGQVEKQVDRRYWRVFQEDIRDAQGKAIGTAVVGLSLEQMHRSLARTRLLLLGGTFAIIIVTALALTVLVRRVINRPIRLLVDSVDFISRGNLDHQVQVVADDEIGQLAVRFNEMTVRLKQSLALVRNIIESMPSMIISVDVDGRITQWNTAATQFTGIPAPEAMGRQFWEIAPQFAKYRNHFQKVIETQRPRQFYREPFQNGNLKYHNISLFPLVADGLNGMVIRVDDITDLENKEEQLRQSQKMETIGTLAGGLAHDFNNVLAGIIGTLSLINYQLRTRPVMDPAELKGRLAVIEESANRATDIVKQLLTLSRKQEITFAPVDLNLSVKHILKLCENTFDKCVDLRAAFAPAAPMVSADPTQVEQVLLNLCVNGYHAMTMMREEGQHQGGRLNIGLEKIYADRHFCERHPEAAEGHYWILSVNDSGVGMDTKTVAKIFDPFFTTKGKGKGTGLGLAVVYSIVQQHHGFIDVYSEPGAGSTFNIYLPAMSDEQAALAAGRGLAELPRGEGLVLVVDDEPVIREMAREMLEMCGYEVLVAENGEVALDLFQQRRGQLKCVLLDMIMPRKSGQETYLEMKRIDPDLRVIVSSGFKLDEKVQGMFSAGVRSFIQKPYTLEKLARAFAEVLGGRSPMGTGDIATASPSPRAAEEAVSAEACSPAERTARE